MLTRNFVALIVIAGSLAGCKDSDESESRSVFEIIEAEAPAARKKMAAFTALAGTKPDAQFPMEPEPGVREAVLDFAPMTKDKNSETWNALVVEREALAFWGSDAKGKTSPGDDFVLTLSGGPSAAIQLSVDGSVGGHPVEDGKYKRKHFARYFRQLAHMDYVVLVKVGQLAKPQVVGEKKDKFLPGFIEGEARLYELAEPTRLLGGSQARLLESRPHW